MGRLQKILPRNKQGQRVWQVKLQAHILTFATCHHSIPSLQQFNLEYALDLELRFWLPRNTIHKWSSHPSNPAARLAHIWCCNSRSAQENCGAHLNCQNPDALKRWSMYLIGMPKTAQKKNKNHSLKNENELSFPPIWSNQHSLAPLVDTGGHVWCAVTNVG